jgi:hypothetical protein
MAGRITPVAQSGDGTYGFDIVDENGRHALYLGFSTWHEADAASRQAQTLLIAAVRCARR